MSDAKKTRDCIEIQKLLNNRRSGITLPVQFDEMGHPIGEYRHEFITALVRTMRHVISCNKNARDMKPEEWRLVWDEMETFFVFDRENRVMRKKMESKAKNIHRDWQYGLGSYIDGKNAHKNVFQEWPQITQEEWTIFVAKYTSPDFIEKVQTKARKIALQNSYHHGLSRGGYQTLEENMIQEKLNKAKQQIVEQRFDESIVSRETIKPKERRQMTEDEIQDASIRIIQSAWQKHQSLTGAPESEAMEFIAQFIIHYGRDRASANNIPQPQKNPVIATQDLSSPRDRSSINRIAIPPSTSRGKNDSPSASRRKNVMTTPSTSRGNVLTTPPSTHDSSVGVQPLYARHDRVYKLVAYGTVHVSRILHGKSIPDDHVKVEVTSTIDGCVRLPVPLGEELVVVSQALGSFVLWPRKLVGATLDDVDDDDDNYDPVAKLRHLLLFNHLTFKNNNTRTPTTYVTGSEESIAIGPEPLQEFIAGNDWLGVSWIQMAMEECASYEPNEIGFMSPNLVSIYLQGHVPPPIIREHILSRLASNYRLFLCPLNTGQHWILLVIDKEQGKVVVLDSLKRKNQQESMPPKRLTEIFNKVWGELFPTIPALKWSCPKKVPKQAECWECGYYVMREMISICNISPNVEDISDHFSKVTKYEPDEIKEVQKIIARRCLTILKT